MKSIKFIALAALAALVMSCGSKPYDAGKVSDLTDRMFSLTPEDYPEVVKQMDGILKENERKVMQGEDGFGSDTELFKSMNQLDNALYGMDSQMDEATKKAYDEFQKRRTAFRGF